MLFENPTPDTGDVSTSNVTPEVTPSAVDESKIDTTEIESTEIESTETSEQSLESDAQSDAEGISLSEFAENLGLSEDDLDVDNDGKIVFKTKVDGKEGRLTPSEFKTAYQKQGHLDNLIREEKSKLESIKSREAETHQQHTQRLQQLDDVYNLAWQELNADFNKIDWNSLREEDPAEFAAKQSEFSQKDQRIKHALQTIQQTRLTKQQEHQQRYIAEQEVALKEAIPEWKDETVGRKEISELHQYGETIGYSPQEMVNVVDSRFLVALRKAKMFDDLEKTKPEINKQVKKARKVARPGTSQKKEAPKRAADILYG